MEQVASKYRPSGLHDVEVVTTLFSRLSISSRDITLRFGFSDVGFANEFANATFVLSNNAATMKKCSYYVL